MSDRCRRGHDLSDPANVYINPLSGKRRCRTCRRAANREYKLPRVLRREILLEHGDGSCAECGHRPQDVTELVLHHDAGGGGEQRRRSIGRPKGSNEDFYRWLRHHGYPDKPALRTLCREVARFSTDP